MNTFVSSLTLILIGLTMFYPIFFSIIENSVRSDQNSKRLLHLNYLLHIFAGCIAVILFWVYSINYPLQLSGVVYLIVIITVVLYYWISPISKLNLFYASIALGFIIFIRTNQEIVQLSPAWPGYLMGLLSSIIISISTFLFVLLTWTKGKQKYFDIALILKLLLTSIMLRFAWDFIVLIVVKIGDQNGQLMSINQFLINNDFTYFVSAILLGIIIPLIIIIYWMAITNKVNDKILLGLSFGLVVIILIAEILYKHFLLQYGISL